ncbi:MAG TPA: VIT domain-containing protein [Pyrinomonadaceae bacterium]|nr:VIT domain-containing protein [Pyrinomonadaceae bacterium]
MHRKFLFKLLTINAAAVVMILFLASVRSPQLTALAQEGEAPGGLQVVDSSGKPKAQCPLKQTTVKAEISGFLSRVVVTQEFDNPFNEKIEAVYTFPLPQNAAVDDMTMLVGNRTVRGKILRREQAEAVYEAARSGGQVASLLNQERPNIFTQSVANILPGEKVKITISYIETLKYEDGSYEFVFPMVVGPRYNPGTATGAPASGNGFSPDTTRVPDGSRITPNPVPEGMRVGHDISLDITLDAGVAIDGVNSKSHAIDLQQTSPGRASVRLKNGPVIPNKDFVLKYDVAGKSISDALLTHRSNQGGFFTFILQPPDRVTVEDVTPKELVFVLDTSGSMHGFPIDKAKETMKLALQSLYPSDTFNLITFAGDTSVLFPEPVPATAENLQKAQDFLDTRKGGGGTEMMKAIKASLDPSDKQGHVRIVCFMTDGYVGNDMEIISEIQKHPNARVFAFGIGSSVNRFLLEKMAENGRGEVEFVALTDDGSAAARRFHERVRNPLLTDISVEWNGLAVSDVYPQRIPDLFSAKPVVLTGRYTAAGRGVLRLKGKMSGREFVREIPVDFPESMAQHDVLAPLWARSRIDNLMSQDFAGAQQGTMKPELKETIINLGLEYRLMTQFTSFVAVEEMIVTDGGQPRRIDVPVEIPEGVNRQGVFGDVAGHPGQNIQHFAALKSSARLYRSQATGGVKDGRVYSGRGVGGTGVGAGGSGSAPVPGRPVSTVNESVVVVDGFESSPEAKAQQTLQTKLHPSLVAVVERLRIKKNTPGAEEIKFVKNGKAELQIWLVDKTPEALAKLKALGFEMVLNPTTSKLVIGRLPVAKLQRLAELDIVRYVAPQTTM